MHRRPEPSGAETKPHRVTVVPGDGIGPAVVGAAQAVLEASGAAFEWDVQQLGYLATGDDGPVPDETVASIRANGVALKGPVATSTSGQQSANVALRRALDLFVQLRPARSLPLPGVPGGIDLVVVRETTEDLYRGIGFAAGTPAAEELAAWLGAHGVDGLSAETAFSIKPTSEVAVRRAAEFTLRWMRQAGRRRLTLVHKATVMRPTDGIFLDVIDDLAATVTDVEFDRRQVDAVCAELVRDPRRFDVLFMPNMYGDIVSDVAAALTGGVGVAPGANHGENVAVFEAVHGTAPAHVGRDDVDPLGMVRSGVMLLDHLGEQDAARRVEAAITRLLRSGTLLTYDLLDSREGAARTSELTAALVDELTA